MPVAMPSWHPGVGIARDSRLLPGLAGNRVKHGALVSASEADQRLIAVGDGIVPALMPQSPGDRQPRRIVDLAFLALITMPTVAIAFRR